MTNNNSVCVIGGDTRQLYAAEYLKNSGFDVKIFACEHGRTNNRIIPCNSLIDAFSAKTILLPLPVSKNPGLLNTPLSSEEILLKEIADKVTDKHLVFLGMGQPTFIKQLKAKTDSVFDYFKNEEFILKNAKLTAEGIVAVMFDRLPISVVGLKTAITGYGRIGSFTAEMLSKLGADVTVFARNSFQLTKASLSGIKAVNIAKINSFSECFDCIINTIPAQIFDETFIKQTKENCLLIETASAPYGFNFDLCDKYKKSLVKAFSLPGKTVPGSAGIVIGETIENYLREVIK